MYGWYFLTYKQRAIIVMVRSRRRHLFDNYFEEHGFVQKLLVRLHNLYKIDPIKVLFMNLF